ncbi:MAG TPA: DUF255 domain-containing protein [Anaerolineae bacterium]|nr:DUF255 domain-containing protein [Anaerolineae bacterium]HOQ99043.1 DUF255 domain-containing protein [Anaerolineae bacterium]HPL30376.1 DUF255 domain-containing protein [Anaerolineae bacterium]
MIDPQEDEVLIGIPWRQWTADAFRQAQESDRPVLLSISATWCHWCHVMDESTFRHPEVIRRVSEELVPIRVDTDRRPDINNRYNLGGWPTTAFLTAQGDILTGETFMPVEEFLSVLDEVMGYYRERRSELEQRLQRRRTRRARISELRHRLRGNVTPEIVDTVVTALRQAYDAEHGGFGPAPKFPLPDTIELALAAGTAAQDEALLDMARTSLMAMAEKGLYDTVDGGFFRYSTTADWTQPHYEKMLDGNARLLSTYLHAAQALDAPLFWQTARGVATYVEANLRDTESGAFAGSADADEDYYQMREDVRRLRNRPRVDPTIYTDRNAMMVIAFLEAAATLDEPYYADVALQALEAVWGRCFIPGAGMAHVYDGSPHLPGLLADQVWMGQALLAAQSHLGRGDYLQRARALMDLMASRLADPDAGGYYDVPFDATALGRLRERLKLLDENALAADLALRLNRLTGDDGDHEAAVGTLEAMAPLYRAYRHHAALYALTVSRFIGPPLHLVLVGDPSAEPSRKLRQAALRIYEPNKLVETVDPNLAPERLAALDLPPAPTPTLYARRGRQTSPPVQDPAQLRAAIEAVPA